MAIAKYYYSLIISKKAEFPDAPTKLSSFDYRSIVSIKSFALSREVAFEPYQDFSI